MTRASSADPNLRALLGLPIIVATSPSSIDPWAATEIEWCSRELLVRLRSGHILEMRLSPIGAPPVVEKRIVYADRVFAHERFRICRVGDEVLLHVDPWSQPHQPLDFAQAIATSFVMFSTAPHRM